MEKKDFVERLTVVLDRAGAVVGCAQTVYTEIVDTETGDIVSSTVKTVEDISVAAFAAHIGAAADQLGQMVTMSNALKQAQGVIDTQRTALEAAAAEATATRLASEQAVQRSRDEVAAKDVEIARLNRALANAAATAATPPSSTIVSDCQFAQALAMVGLITQDEAVAWVAAGVLPAAMAAIVDTLPPDQRFGAKMLLQGATTFDAANPLVSQIGSAAGKTPEQIAEIFRIAAAL